MTTWTKILQENPGGDRTLGLGTLACLEWGPDGRVLATGGSAGVVLWDIRDRRVLGRCALEIAPIAAIAFAADGKRLAALGDSGKIALCDVARPGAPELARMGEEDEEDLDARRNAKLVFSPDGALLLVMGEEHAWLVQDGRARRLTGENGALGKEVQAARVAGFSSASEIVTIEERVVAFHRPDDRGTRFQRSREIRYRPGQGRSEVSADGRFLFVPATVGVKSRFAIVSLDTGDVLAEPRFHQTVYGARFAWRSPVVCVDVYGTPTIVAFPERAGEELPARENAPRLDKMAASDYWSISPGGDLLALGDGYGGNVVFHDLQGREAPPPLGRYTFDADSAFMLGALDARAERAVVLGFIMDGQNSSAWAQGWELAEDRPGPILTESGALFCMNVPPVPGTDSVVLPLDTGGVALVDRATGTSRTLEHEDAFQNAAVGHDGTVVAAGSATGCLVLWDRESGRQLASIQAHHEQICGLGWQPGGDLLATSSQDGTVRFWSARALLDAGASGEENGEGTADSLSAAMAVVDVGDMLYQIAFSADGSLCAVGTAEGGACVIRAGTGEIVARVEGHGQEVMALAFHPRTGELVTGSLDGTLKVWEPMTATTLVELSYETEASEGLPDRGITSVGFDAVGEAFLLSHGDGLIRWWKLPPA
jgi:WD40 repeat protein